MQPWQILINLIRADPSFPSWLFALFCFSNNNNHKHFSSRNRNNFRHDVCSCFGRTNKKLGITKYSGLHAALVQTTPALRGTGVEAELEQVSATSQNLPHFQFSSIKGVSLSLPPLPSCWLCSWAVISQVTGWVRDTHPSAFTSRPFLSYKSPPPLQLSLSQLGSGSKIVSKNSSQSSSAPKPT